MTNEQILQLVEQLQLINLVHALERTEGDGEVLRDAARDYLESYEEMLDTVSRATEEKDPTLLRRSAHALKGAVRNFGARQAQAAAYRLEMMGRLSEFEGSYAALACLRVALEDLKPEMETLAQRQA